MKTLIVGDCAPDHLFDAIDQTDALERDFELSVVKALTCAYPTYRCITFGGTFRLDDRGSRPDLALISKDLSHWFVIEVELSTHSFDGHVLPQVRAFRYGEPQQDCANILARELGIDVAQAQTLVQCVPRFVAVIANRYVAHWEIVLDGVGAQLLSVTVFNSGAGVTAYGIEGVLAAPVRSLGFGQYSATDRSVRFATNLLLPDGQIEICEPSGTISLWNVARTSEAAWVTRSNGRPDIPNGAYIMLTRTYQNRLVFRAPYL